MVVRDDYWRKINYTGGYKNAADKHENLFQASITYYLDGERHFGVGIDYSENETPEKGLPEQAIKMLSLKVKF